MVGRKDNGWLPLYVSHPTTCTITIYKISSQTRPYQAVAISTPRFLRAHLSQILLPTTFILLLLGFYRFEPHIELAFYDRTFISKHITQVEKLAGCFDQGRISASYNISKHIYGPKRTQIHAGMPMRIGLDCYDFAGTINFGRTRTENKARIT